VDLHPVSSLIWVARTPSLQGGPDEQRCEELHLERRSTRRPKSASAATKRSYSRAYIDSQDRATRRFHAAESTRLLRAMNDKLKARISLIAQTHDSAPQTMAKGEHSDPTRLT
jgi:hypothetical protein